MVTLSQIRSCCAPPPVRFRAACGCISRLNEAYLYTLFLFDETRTAYFPENLQYAASPISSRPLYCGDHSCCHLDDPTLYQCIREAQDRESVRQHLTLFNEKLNELQRALLVAVHFSGRHEYTQAMVMAEYSVSRRTCQRELKTAMNIMIKAWHLDENPY